MPIIYINDVPIDCINQAAIAYEVPATLIISVLKTENGRVGQANSNPNRTIDYGPMQINSLWLSRLKKAGYTVESIQYNPCVNVRVGTWILSQNIASETSLWQGVGNYHSHTASKNYNYHSKVKAIYSLLNAYIK